MKPLFQKNYGSIGHLPGSRLGKGDHKICKGQAKILLDQTRNFRDLVIVQEKLDGANVGILRHEGELIALTRKGHRAIDSQLEQFKVLAQWTRENENLFDFLEEGERLVGEWLYMAHGTRYLLPHDYFVAFDLFTPENKRIVYTDFLRRIDSRIAIPKILHIGSAISIKKVEKLLGVYGHHGALEEAEGAVWRVEREGNVDFLGKYVRSNKEDGKYFNDDFNQLIFNEKRK